MDLKEYIKLIKKNAKTIAAIALIVGISAFTFSILSPVKYEVSQSVFIGKNGTQETDDFKYDGYYAFEASDMLSDSIAVWLKSPEVVNAIYDESGIDPKFKNIKSYSKKFKAKKLSPEYVEVYFQSNDADAGGRIANAIVEVLGSKIKSISNLSKGEVAFSISGGKPIIIENKPDALFNFILGIFSGLIFGTLIAVSKEYFSID